MAERGLGGACEPVSLRAHPCSASSASATSLSPTRPANASPAPRPSPGPFDGFARARALARNERTAMGRTAAKCRPEGVRAAARFPSSARWLLSHVSEWAGRKTLKVFPCSGRTDLAASSVLPHKHQLGACTLAEAHCQIFTISIFHCNHSLLHSLLPV